MRQSVLGGVLLACLSAACGTSAGSDSNPTGPTPPATRSLAGIITETAPTETVPIAGATVTIEDGPHAGQTAISSSIGRYSFTGLQPAGFTIRAAASGYLSRSQGVTLTSDQTVNFQLEPSFRLRCPSAALTLDAATIAMACTVTSSGAGNVVDLACLNPPAGVPCAFAPNPVTLPAGATVPANLAIGLAFLGQPGTYAFQVTARGTDGLRQTANLQLTITGTCSGFVEQPSYTGTECGTGGGICWGFSDGYRLFTRGEFFGAPGFEFRCAERTVQVVRGSAADYHHVLGTILLKRAPSTR